MRLRPGSRSMRLVVLLVLAATAASLLPDLHAERATAQVTVTPTDINPNSSDLDPINPNGASGGRVNKLASVPGSNQIVYAASEWGGLYRTNDGGMTWARLNRHVPNVTWDVKVDPSNANRVYATSWYDGRVNSIAGINVSTDGGTTWTHPATATPPPAFNCSAARRTEPSAFGIGIRPDAPNNVFIGTNCGVARSTDSGVTWTFIDPTPMTTASDVWAVVVQAGGPMGQGIVDICGNDGHLRSVDGGNNWVRNLTLPTGRCSLAVSPDENYVLFASVGAQIFESDDGGVNWTLLGTPEAGPQGRIDFVKTNQRANVAMTNVFDLWFGDINLWRAQCTTPAMPAPGGATRCQAPPNPIAAPWFGPFSNTVGAHNDLGDIVFDPTVAVDACPLIHSNDGGVYRNTVGASPGCHTPTWEQPNVTPHSLWLWTLAGVNQPGAAAEDLYFGLQDNGSWATINAGAVAPTWNNRDCCDVFDAGAQANRVLYTVCCNGASPFSTMFLANQGMAGAAAVPNTPPGFVQAFKPINGIIRFGVNQYAVLTAQTDGLPPACPCSVFITLNVTTNPIVWTQLTGAPANACGVKVAVAGGTPTFFVQSGACDSRTGDQLWRYTGTVPGGMWTRVDNTLLGAGPATVTGGLSIFTVDPNDPNRLFAANLSPAGPRMLRSLDSGASWLPDGLLDLQMTGGGAFRYQTLRGPTDFTSFNGYPQPTLLAVNHLANNIVVAGGADSGVFLSTNSGANWTRITDPFDPGGSGIPHLPRPRWAHFDLDTPGVVSIYVGTQGRGVWKLNVGASALVACVNNGTGAVRMINPTATPAGTGKDRACAAGETQVNWPGALGPEPLVHACVSNATGASRITNSVPLPTGTGKDRACATTETHFSWPTAGPAPTLFNCVNNLTGAWRVITSTATPGGTGQNRSCAANETQVTWPRT